MTHPAQPRPPTCQKSHHRSPHHPVRGGISQAMSCNSTHNRHQQNRARTSIHRANQTWPVGSHPRLPRGNPDSSLGRQHTTAAALANPEHDRAQPGCRPPVLHCQTRHTATAAAAADKTKRARDTAASAALPHTKGAGGSSTSATAPPAPTHSNNLGRGKTRPKGHAAAATTAAASPKNITAETAAVANQTRGQAAAATTAAAAPDNAHSQINRCGESDQQTGGSSNHCCCTAG